MFVLIWMNFLRHYEHFDNVFYSYSVALCPAHAAPHAGGQHQSYVPFRIVSGGRYVPLYHNDDVPCRLRDATPDEWLGSALHNLLQCCPATFSLVSHLLVPVIKGATNNN